MAPDIWLSCQGLERFSAKKLHELTPHSDLELVSVQRHLKYYGI
jgi:hypothetical protein